MLKQFYWKNSDKLRYYKIMVVDDGINGLKLVCNWGSTVTRRGNRKILSFKDRMEGVKFVTEMMKRRTNRGYQLIKPSLH